MIRGHGSLKLTPAVAAPVIGAVTSTLRKVEPTNAQEWLSKALWSKQRKYRDWHAEELAETMRRSEFTQGTMIHFAKFGSEIHLINGQHTLNAVVKYGKPVNLTVLTTAVENDEQIAELYARDDQHLRRSFTDVYSAHDLTAKHGLSTSQINAIGGGFSTMICGFAASKKSVSYEARSSSQRIRMFKEYGDAAVAYFGVIKGAPVAIMGDLRSASVIGVALRTFKESPEKAAEFWSQVAFDDGLKIGDPRKTLNAWLQANPVRVTNAAARSRVVAHAWNIFLAGGSAQRFKMPDWTKPIQINIA